MITCPQCGSEHIVAYDDARHNVKIVSCGKCKLSFAVMQEEIYRYYGASPVYENDVLRFIDADWHRAYNARQKLTGGESWTR